jgi:hypothetical protein
MMAAFFGAVAVEREAERSNLVADQEQTTNVKPYEELGQQVAALWRVLHAEIRHVEGMTGPRAAELATSITEHLIDAGLDGLILQPDVTVMYGSPAEDNEDDYDEDNP